MKIGIISDIHEDYLRLKEAMRCFEKHHCDAIACLGDMTGFDVMHYKYISTRNASDCIALIRDNCKYVTAGNHDLYNVGKIPSRAGLFNFPDDWYEQDFADRHSSGNQKVWLYEDHDLSPRLSRRDRNYILELPEYLIIEADSKRVLLSHSIEPDMTGSAIWRPRTATDFQHHFQFMIENQCQIGISGHFHPAGVEMATQESYRIRSFGKYNIPGDQVHFIAPCIAAGSGYNGFSIMDLKQMTLEIIPLRSKKHLFDRFV